MFFGVDGDFVEFVYDRCIVFVVWVYCDCVVVEYSFGVCCGDRDIVVFFFECDIFVFVFFDVSVGCVVCEWVFEVLYMVRGFDVFDFKI